MENYIKIILLSFYDIVSLCRLYLTKRCYSYKKKMVRDSCQKCEKLFLFFYHLTTTCGYTFINNTPSLKLRNFIFILDLLRQSYRTSKDHFKDDFDPTQLLLFQ